jgi:hypothetical protein
VQAVKKKLKQLHYHDVLCPVSPKSIGVEDRRQALPYLIFLKQKRTGEIKDRGCAVCCKKRLYHNKEDASSPTVAIELVMLTSVIDAEESRDIATVDISGAFMQASIDKTVYMKIDGTMADLLVELEPTKCKHYVTDVLDKKARYVRSNKALYGNLRAARLFWQKLTYI